MDVSKLTDIVREVWNFIWPPVIQFTILLVLMRMIAPRAFGRLTERLRNLVDRQRGAIAILRLYGLRKFVGVIAAFAVLFVLYVGQQALEGVGRIVPGQVTYTPSTAWLRHAQPEETGCFLARHPGTDLSSIENLVDLEKATLKAKGESGTQVFASDYPRSIWVLGAFNLAKSFFVLTIVLAVTEIVVARSFIRPLFAMVFCQLVCVVVGAYLVYAQIDAYEQRTFDYIRDSRVLASMAGFKCEDLNTPAQLEAQTAIWRAMRYDRGERWWNLRFEGSDFFTKARRILQGDHLRMGRPVSGLVPIRPPEMAPSPAVRRDLSGVVSSWYLKTGFAVDMSSLASQGYFPPDSFPSQDQLQPGTIVVRAAHQSRFAILAPPWEILPKLGAPNQDSRVPSMRMSEKECIPVRETVSPGDIYTLSFPFDERLNQEIAVITERLVCVPQKAKERSGIVLGYRLARLQ
jgi:hypothetical protein